MKRLIIQLNSFAKQIDMLFKQRKLLEEDFYLFERYLLEHPESGDLIVGTGGIRKARLKSFAGGKSGGFRVCYFDNPENEELFFILLYSKNEKEDLSNEEKKMLKSLTNILKGKK